MFKNIFGKKEGKIQEDKTQSEEVNKSKVSWIPLTSVDQIAELKAISKNNHVAVFKHSTRCIISRTVLQRFEEEFPEGLEVQLYYIDLLNYRDVSLAIADEFLVVHQSPQLVVIKDEKVVTHASHHDITQINLEEVIN